MILKNNSLSGSLPTQLGGLTALSVMRLQGNAFSGTIPQELAHTSECDISTTSSYQCPLPDPSTSCTSGISCTWASLPPPSPPSLPPLPLAPPPSLWPPPSLPSPPSPPPPRRRRRRRRLVGRVC